MSDTTQVGADLRTISELSTLAEIGFRGGRDGLHAFCGSIFLSDEPRFLRTEGGDLVVFRHADLRALSIQPELGTPPPITLLARRVGGDRDVSQLEKPTPWVFANQLFFSNEPIHAPLRRILLNLIGPKPTREFEALARSVVKDLADTLEDGATIDLMRDFTQPLMAGFWGRAIGLDPDEIRQLALVLGEMGSLNLFERKQEHQTTLDAAFAAYRALIENGALRTLATGGNPMVDQTAVELAEIHLQNDPDLAGIVPANAGAFLAGNLFDGLHTAGLGAANTLHVLLRRPEALAAAKAHPDKIATVVSEALRLEPALASLSRFALEDVVYDGLLIPKGTRLMMMWGAGNRDPKVFPDPERFDIDRAHQGLTTFGSGARLCPGRFVAGMLIRTMVEGLVAEGLGLEPLSDEDAWWEASIALELKALPVGVRRQSAQA